MTVTDWLLDSDPAIRWQVMRDLTNEPEEVAAAERARIANEGWGARLLALQDDDGQWAGGTYFPPLTEEPKDQPWTATAWTLQLLRQIGVDPSNERVRSAVALVRKGSRWEYDGSAFFDGEVEPCINGMTVAIGSYFGEDVHGLVDRLLSEQLEDGGWNCEAENGSIRSSFNSTIAVLEGLLEFEQVAGGSPEVMAARERAQEYLLDRHLMRRLSTGEVPKEGWLEFSFPTRWHYDVLRALDYLRSAGAVPDERAKEAIELVESKRGADGRWLLENTHRGAVHFELEEGEGKPSRWNTLRALRVLDWYRG
ncbi:prenyltransferase/squalene oxidase repeat-containing protein [Arthrobacter monumenti]